MRRARSGSVCSSCFRRRRSRIRSTYDAYYSRGRALIRSTFKTEIRDQRSEKSGGRRALQGADLRVGNLSCFTLSLLSLVFGHGVGGFVVVNLGLVEVSGVCADDGCKVLLLPWWRACASHGFFTDLNSPKCAEGSSSVMLRSSPNGLDVDGSRRRQLASCERLTGQTVPAFAVRGHWHSHSVALLKNNSKRC